MTRIKIYKMVQRQNINIPLFRKSGLAILYCLSFLMTLEEQPCLSGSKYWWVIDSFSPELTGRLASHRATLWTKGSPFSLCLFLCLCGKGLWLNTPERLEESRKPIAYFLWQWPQPQKTHMPGGWQFLGIRAHWYCTVTGASADTTGERAHSTYFTAVSSAPGYFTKRVPPSPVVLQWHHLVNSGDQGCGSFIG